MIIYGFTSRSRIFHLCGDVTITGEGMYNFGLCSALRAYEQKGIFVGRSGSVVELPPCDRKVVSSSPARAGRVKPKMLK